MLSNEFNKLLNELKFFFDDNYDKFSKNIEALEKIISEKNDDEVEYCGSRLRVILEIVLACFAKKMDPTLFNDPNVDEKTRGENFYRIKKINEQYKIDPKVITSLHNIRLFSNSVSHLNDEEKSLQLLSNTLIDIKEVLYWIHNIYANAQAAAQNQNNNSSREQTSNATNSFEDVRDCLTALRVLSTKINNRNLLLNSLNFINQQTLFYLNSNGIQTLHDLIILSEFQLKVLIRNSSNSSLSFEKKKAQFIFLINQIINSFETNGVLVKKISKPTGSGKIGGIINICWSVLVIIFSIVLFQFSELLAIFATKSILCFLFICIQFWNIVVSIHFLKGKNNLLSVRLSSFFSLSLFGLVFIFYYIFKMKKTNN